MNFIYLCNGRNISFDEDQIFYSTQPCLIKYKPWAAPHRIFNL